MITGERPRRGLKDEEEDRSWEERGEDRELWRAVLPRADADSPTFFPVALVDLSERLGADIVRKRTDRFTNYDVNFRKSEWIPIIFRGAMASDLVISVRQREQSFLVVEYVPC